MVEASFDILFGNRDSNVRIGISPNSMTLIIHRAVTGIGVAGYLAGSYVTIEVAVAEKQRPALIGLMSSAYAIASVIGPLV